MRPTAKQYRTATRTVVAMVFACLASTLAAHAQDSTTNYPTAIISSGGSGLSPAPVSGQNPVAIDHSVSAPSWTAERNPASGNLRPNNAQAYPPLPVAHSTVVTAAAQEPVVSNIANGGEIGTSKHIPLAPPSDRFKGETPQPASSPLQTAVSVGSSLLLVVGLFLGVAWCYRKTIHSTVGGGLSKQVVNVLGRSSISARQQMVLIRFGSKLLLVSVIQGEARTLSEITDPLEVDQLVGLCESGQPGSITNSFKSVLLQEGKR